MVHQVTFSVNCADTRLGFHVRVVGSCSALGGWSPQKALPLHTSAAEFPAWRSTNATVLAKDEVIEYKYVICDNEGRPERWEERPNRSMHLSSLEAKGILNGGSGQLSVHEAFNGSCEPDEVRFKAMRSQLQRTSSSPLARMNSKLKYEAERGDSPEDGSDLFAPTIRERRPSMSLIQGSLEQMAHDQQDMMTAARSASKSCFSDLEIVQQPMENGMPEQPGADCAATGDGMAADDRPAGLVAVSSKGGLVREESCSNLFLDAGEVEDLKVVSEFEDKYMLVGNGPLGEGTFGLVWRCTPKAAAAAAEVVKERAAKIVRKSRLQPRDMRYLLGEDGEVRTHLTMKHRHIVELFEYFDEPSTVTLVLEYCRGGDLFDAIVRQSKQEGQGRGFQEAAAAIVTQHLLLALGYIHSHRVVHRDIKCENVLLAHLDVPVEQNVFKLCDFGFAAHDTGEGLTDRLGSPDTVAPEVVVGTPYSTPADLWSTGVLIYMMLSANAPFCASTDSEVLRKVRTGSYSLSGGVWDKVSVPPKNMIASLMTVNAKLRPTARDALRSEWLKDLPAVDA